MANHCKKWNNEDDSKLVNYLNEYKTLLHPENANIKVPDYEKIANELGRSEYAILLRVIDKILYKKYNDINVNFKDLSLNYNIPSNFLKERFELNNMNTDMVGKKWTDDDDEYINKSIEEGITYLEIAKHLKRKQWGVILRVIDKILYKKYKDGIDIQTLKDKYKLSCSLEYLLKRFELNNMNTDMVGKKWTDDDDEYINKSIEEGITYLEIAKHLKRKQWGVILRVIDKILYKKYKDGIDIQTLKDKYKLSCSLEYLTKIFNKIDKKTEIYTILKNKEKELNDELKNKEIKIKIKLSN